MYYNPKKFKFLKKYKIKSDTKFKKINFLSFGTFGIKSKKKAFLTSKQINAVKLSLINKNKKGKFWIRIFPNKLITIKSKGMRMGSGKGNIYYLISNISSNQIIYETDNNISIKNILISVSKLPISIKIIEKKKFNKKSKKFNLFKIF